MEFLTKVIALIQLFDSLDLLLSNDLSLYLLVASLSKAAISLSKKITSLEEAANKQEHWRKYFHSEQIRAHSEMQEIFEMLCGESFKKASDRLVHIQSYLNSRLTLNAQERENRIQYVLSPTIQLSGAESIGSGVILASLPLDNKKDSYETYAITAYHVARNILADDPSIRKNGFTLTQYTSKGKSDFKCDMVAFNPKRDIALVKIRSKVPFSNSAKLPTRKELKQIDIWNPVWAVGCPLGNDPIPTGGFISSLKNDVRGTSYWMVNAPTYYGNSGGGIFEAENKKLIGVFSKIYTHGSTRPVVIPHMGLVVPMHKVYDFLDKNGYKYLYDPSAPRPLLKDITQINQSSSQPPTKERKSFEKLWTQKIHWR